MAANPDDVVTVQQNEQRRREIVKNKVERILEMSFDHGAAMISLLRKEAMEIKAGSELRIPYLQGISALKRNIQILKDNLENLKDGKGNKLEVFQHKCQEFGL